MSLTERATWAGALATATAAKIQSWLGHDVQLTDAGRIISGPEAVAAALTEAVGPASDPAEVIEFSDPSVVAVQRRDPVSEGVACLVLSTGFDGEGRVGSITLRRISPPVVQVGIEHQNQAPVELLGGECRVLAEGISLRAFASVKRVTKQWGNETWLHSDSHPFGFKVIRLRAGCRTSLQFHEQKDEVYFVLDGLARLHYRDGDTIATAPFVQGTVALVPPLAWHRVEAITDVTLIEASTYDDGTDNVRVEDDYGRPSGLIEAEHGQ